MNYKLPYVYELILFSLLIGTELKHLFTRKLCIRLVQRTFCIESALFDDAIKNELSKILDFKRYLFRIVISSVRTNSVWNQISTDVYHSSNYEDNSVGKSLFHMGTVHTLTVRMMLQVSRQCFQVGEPPTE